MIYRAVLRQQANPPDLYLAVSEIDYNGILSEKLGIIVRNDVNIKLVVIDEFHEVVAQWIP